MAGKKEPGQRARRGLFALRNTDPFAQLNSLQAPGMARGFLLLGTADVAAHDSQ